VDLSELEVRDDVENYMPSFKSEKFVKNDIGGSCSAEISTKSVLQNSKGSNHFGNPNTDGRILSES
jgi:hypothetical protein